MLGALAQAVGGGLRRLQHLARAADELAGDQERQQHVGDPGELTGPHDQVVLVAAVGVARRVGVVLEQVDVAADALVGQPLLGIDQQVLQDALTGAVVGDQLGQVVAFGGCVLGVAAHIEVQPGSVAEEHVGTAAPRHHPPEQIAGNLVGAEPAMAMEGAGHTEFRLDAHDSSLHANELTGWFTATVDKRALTGRQNLDVARGTAASPIDFDLATSPVPRRQALGNGRQRAVGQPEDAFDRLQVGADHTLRAGSAGVDPAGSVLFHRDGEGIGEHAVQARDEHRRLVREPGVEHAFVAALVDDGFEHGHRGAHGLLGQLLAEQRVLVPPQGHEDRHSGRVVSLPCGRRAEVGVELGDGIETGIGDHRFQGRRRTLRHRIDDPFQQRLLRPEVVVERAFGHLHLGQYVLDGHPLIALVVDEPQSGIEDLPTTGRVLIRLDPTGHGHLPLTTAQERA